MYHYDTVCSSMSPIMVVHFFQFEKCLFQNEKDRFPEPFCAYRVFARPASLPCTPGCAPLEEESAKFWGELSTKGLFRPHDGWQTAAVSGHRG